MKLRKIKPKRKMLQWMLKMIEPFQEKVLKFQVIKFALLKIYKIFAPNEWIQVETEGIRMYVNLYDVWYLKLFSSTKGKYEEGTTKVFKKHLRKGMIMIDIGANIGYYSLIAARIVGKDGKVFAFEPHPSNYEWLRKNIEINGFTNVIPINKAIADKNDLAKLFCSDVCGGYHSLLPSKYRKPYIECETIALDDFFEENDISPNVIKMDIEGTEIFALKGMERTIERCDDLCMSIEYGLSKYELFDFLKEYFKIYHIKKDGELVSIDNFKGKEKESFEPNVWCIRR